MKSTLMIPLSNRRGTTVLFRKVTKTSMQLYYRGSMITDFFSVLPFADIIVNFLKNII